MQPFRRLTLVSLAAMTLITGCGTATGDSGPASDGAGEVSAEPLQFTAQTIGDESFEGSSLAAKDSVLWFWAPWCTECRPRGPGTGCSSGGRRR